MEGEAARAFLKTSLTALSDSPTYLLSSCKRRAKGEKEGQCLSNKDDRGNALMAREREK